MYQNVALALSSGRDIEISYAIFHLRSEIVALLRQGSLANLTRLRVSLPTIYRIRARAPWDCEYIAIDIKVGRNNLSLERVYTLQFYIACISARRNIELPAQTAALQRAPTPERTECEKVTCARAGSRQVTDNCIREKMEQRRIRRG